MPASAGAAASAAGAAAAAAAGTLAESAGRPRRDAARRGEIARQQRENHGIVSHDEGDMVPIPWCDGCGHLVTECACGSETDEIGIDPNPPVTKRRKTKADANPEVIDWEARALKAEATLKARMAEDLEQAAKQAAEDRKQKIATHNAEVMKVFDAVEGCTSCGDTDEALTHECGGCHKKVCAGCAGRLSAPFKPPAFKLALFRAKPTALVKKKNMPTCPLCRCVGQSYVVDAQYITQPVGSSVFQPVVKTYVIENFYAADVLTKMPDYALLEAKCPHPECEYSATQAQTFDLSMLPKELQDRDVFDTEVIKCIHAQNLAKLRRMIDDHSKKECSAPRFWRSCTIAFDPTGPDDPFWAAAVKCHDPGCTCRFLEAAKERDDEHKERYKVMCQMVDQYATLINWLQPNNPVPYAEVANLGGPMGDRITDAGYGTDATIAAASAAVPLGTLERPNPAVVANLAAAAAAAAYDAAPDAAIDLTNT